jgi:hypothetical protein
VRSWYDGDLFSDRKRQGGWWLDACSIYVLTAILIFPLFRVKYLDRWDSIESTFIADARLLQENWAHHLWQPLWYLGTRADYVYPPGLRYGVAMLSWSLHCTPAKAYHIFIGLLYAFGIVSVYLWVRTASESRRMAWLAAAGVALVSPCLLLVAEWRLDSPFLVPWRLHVLMTYGEGPHISSLAVLPIVWLAAWRRFLGGNIRWLLLSAGAAAMVATLNFYGATALAITFPLLAWACFIESRDWRIFRDSLSIAALAWGMTAWWLTPSYVSITMRNLELVAPRGNAWSAWVLAIALIAYVGTTSYLRREFVSRGTELFVWSAFGFLGLYIFGDRWFGFQVAGVPPRLIPEWDLFAVLCGVLLATQGWKLRPGVARAAVVLLVIACIVPSWQYLTHAYVEFRKDDEWQQRLEYKTPEWLWQKFPEQRVFAGGTIEFWYNVWRDGPQATGGSRQGILNPFLAVVPWRIVNSQSLDFVVHWLQAMGVDIVVVSGPTSKELYKDFHNQALYDAHFSLLRDDGEGNRYYRVPRRVPGIARVVDRMKLLAAPAIPMDYEDQHIRAYAEAIEAEPPGGDARDRARGKWKGSDEFDVEVETRSGEALLVEETYDPYWQAYSDGTVRTIWRDAAGLMMVDLPPGKHSVRMVFETPLEIMVGRVLTIATFVLCCWFLVVGHSRARDALE